MAKVLCPKCNGDRHIIKDTGTAFLSLPCPTCYGMGKVEKPVAYATLQCPYCRKQINMAIELKDNG